MPIYEYRCSACGHELEVLQKMSDPPMTDCPACGKAALAKRVSAAGFQLKGSGWYVTDFRDGKKPKADGKDKDGAGAGADSTGSKAETAADSSGNTAKSTETASSGKRDKPGSGTSD